MKLSLRSLLFAAALVFVAAPPAGAGGRPATPAPESTERVYVMTASGTLRVAPDGSVRDVQVLTKIEEPLRVALDARVRKLRFEPMLVGGKPVEALTGFTAEMIGREQDGKLAVTMDSIDFDTPKGAKPVLPDGAMAPITSARMSPPEFPQNEMRAGYVALVKVLIRVGPDGNAVEAAVVDSQVYDGGLNPSKARAALHRFELSALKAARHWTFNVPADAATRSPREMTVGVPIAYVFQFKEGFDLRADGQWLLVQRAPKRLVAWLPPEQSRQIAASAVSAGQVSGGEGAFRLVTPLDDTPVL